jgi:hypothetical protein
MEVKIPVISEDRIIKRTKEVVPFGFKMSDYVRWGYLISDENKEIRKNEISLLRIKLLRMPANTMISSLGVIRHPYGVVLDVVGTTERFDEEKIIDRVFFLGTENSKIEEGDLLGTVKIIFIGVGLIINLRSVEIPRVQYGDEKIEFILKYRKDSKLRSIKTKKSTHGYWRSNLAYTEAIISDENFSIKSGEVKEIKIRDIDLPPYTVTVKWGLIENVDVYPVEIYGESSRIEDERVVSQAVVIGLADGKIKKNELLGHVNVYFVATQAIETKLKEKRILKAFLKYSEDDIKDKKLRYLHPTCFKRKDKARWDIIVSDEDKKVEKGKPVFIKIRDLIVPDNSIITPLYGMMNAIGTILGVYQPGVPPEIGEEKFISHALFLPVIDAEIEKGDLLGIINVYKVEPMTFEGFSSKLDRWKDYINYKLSKK